MTVRIRYTRRREEELVRLADWQYNMPESKEADKCRLSRRHVCLDDVTSTGMLCVLLSPLLSAVSHDGTYVCARYFSMYFEVCSMRLS